MDVTTFEAKLVDAGDNDQDGYVDKDDCDAAGTDITLEGDAHRLELANNGKAFCLRATDIFGNTSAWSVGVPGFREVATLSYGFGGVSVVERVGEAPPSFKNIFFLRVHRALVVISFFVPFLPP